MYITINGKQYTCRRRVVKTDRVRFMSVTPEVEEISGIVAMYRDDGFLLSEDNADDFARKFQNGTVLTLTNEPESTYKATEPTAEQLLNAILGVSENKMAAALSLRGSVEQITSLVRTETTQSDKLGFDWVETYVGDVIVKKEYIEQENPVGTSAENPIVYTEGMALIDNAFYLVDGSIKVWMGEWVDWE